MGVRSTPQRGTPAQSGGCHPARPPQCRTLVPGASPGLCPTGEGLVSVGGLSPRPGLRGSRWVSLMGGTRWSLSNSERQPDQDHMDSVGRAVAITEAKAWKVWVAPEQLLQSPWWRYQHLRLFKRRSTGPSEGVMVGSWPPNPYAEVLTRVPQNVTLLGDQGFTYLHLNDNEVNRVRPNPKRLVPL